MPKILLVEDDINLREIYAARLGAEKYQVVSASDGEEALAMAVREKPDLILLDIMMPKISGFDVLDILRSTPATKATKVIMLTALSQNIDKARGQKLGVNRYLVKSQITLEDVVLNIRELLMGDVTAPPRQEAPGPEAGSREWGDVETAVTNLREHRVKLNTQTRLKPNPESEPPKTPPSGA